MLYTHYTEEILGLQGVNVKKVVHGEEKIEIYAHLEQRKQYCKGCGAATLAVHDYRTQKVKDVPAFGKQVVLYLRKRRYRCECCGKRFYENNSFLPKYSRMTNRLIAFVIDRLRDERSFTSVAHEVNISVTTVIRIFDLVSYPKAKLSHTLSIDEFKGNTSGEKYQCILTDPVNKVVLDILPERYGHYLTHYFSEFPREEREKVQFFVSDMWRTYADSSAVWFKNATQIVDKYHWIRQAIWAFENVRKEEQKKFSKTHRRYFKRSKSLLIKRFDELNDEQKQQVNVMLYISSNLSRAHWYKESFLKILDNPDGVSRKKALRDWIQCAICCEIPQFEKCAKPMQNWSEGIINSLDSTITNGFTEGCNNKIKVLKRNAYGYQSFKRFRNRILHIFSHKHFLYKQAAT